MPDDASVPTVLTRRRALGAGVATLVAVAASGCDQASRSSAGSKARSTNGSDGGGDAGPLESPMLSERVKAGRLPPLKERLPDNPVVAKPLTTVGRFGGTLRGTTVNPNATSDIQTTMIPALFRFSDDLSERYPELAESAELSADYTSCTINLRPGIRWSDGTPFTADDMMFYFEAWQFDPDLSPILSPQWVQGGKRMSVTKVGKYSVRFDFALPNPSFALLQVSAPPPDPYLPAHFMKQFHPKWNKSAKQQAKDAGFENWMDHFLSYADVHYGAQPPERPDLTAWVPVKNDQTAQRYERNPYYWKVDPDGRQLPYIDKVVVTYVADLQVTELKAESGDSTISGRDLAIDNYPVLKRSEERGGYTATLFKSERGADVAVAFNQVHEDPALREIFNNVKFRQAASVAINREEINKLVFLGQGKPRQATINSTASFYKKEWGEHFAQHDPDLANQLLDEIGLQRRTSDGIRLRPDGAPLRFQLEYVPDYGAIGPTVPLLARHWRNVGLDVRANARDKSYMSTRVEAGKQDATMWLVDRALERSVWAYGPNGGSKFRPGGDSVITYAQAWITWLESAGKEGTEPPAEAKELWDALKEWQQYDFQTPDYTRAGTKVFDLVQQTLWVIGIVGEGPYPAEVSNSLENVLPEAALKGDQPVWFGAANWYWLPHRSEQWFFRDS